jgi:hypothetical protein
MRDSWPIVGFYFDTVLNRSRVRKLICVVYDLSWALFNGDVSHTDVRTEDHVAGFDNACCRFMKCTLIEKDHCSAGSGHGLWISFVQDSQLSIPVIRGFVFWTTDINGNLNQTKFQFSWRSSMMLLQEP